MQRGRYGRSGLRYTGATRLWKGYVGELSVAVAGTEDEMRKHYGQATPPLVDARGVSQKLRGRPLGDTRGATSTRIDDPEAHCIRCGARANVVVFDVGAMCAKHADEERGIERPGTIRVPRGEPIDTSKIPWDRVDITLAPEDRPRPKETPGPGGPPRVGTANTS